MVSVIPIGDLSDIRKISHARKICVIVGSALGIINNRLIESFLFGIVSGPPDIVVFGKGHGLPIYNEHRLNKTPQHWDKVTAD